MSYKCKICKKNGQLFETHYFTNSVIRHISTKHRGEKPNLCTICGKSFSEKAHLKSHIQEVHENIRPFKCPLCEKRCARKRQLIIHAKNIHQATLSREEITEVKGDLKYVEPIDEEKKPFKCKLCDIAFSATGKVSLHGVKSFCHFKRAYFISP